MDNKEEAYYVCGLLSSTEYRNTIHNFMVGTQITPSIIKNLFQKTVEEVGEKDAIFRYNKIYKKVFSDKESPEKFGIDDLIDKKY